MSKKAPTSEPKIAPQPSEEAPTGWADVQESLAASSGLSILLVNGHQPPELLSANNNSICAAFQSSSDHASLCDPYCGDAHQRAMKAGSVTYYKCHAGLQCFAMPVKLGAEPDLAAIGGRAFVTAGDYRSLIERFRAGDLKDLLTRYPFRNVIFAEDEKLDQLASSLEKAAQDFEGGGPKQRVTKSRGSVTPTQLNISQEDELKHLRSELDYRSRLAESLQHFLERISSTDPAKTYLSIVNNSKALLNSERASLLAFDEVTNELTLKAAVGFSTDLSEIGRVRLGEGVAGLVLESGKPLLVRSLEGAGIEPATPERFYKTESFISYPIIIGGRKIGVLNATDKSGGRAFDEVDLSLLDIIGPQVAIALDRAEWQERATEFQLMSITDSLTSLPNRRYLQERLMEELNRSRRYDYSMSFLMIDIDDFKHYNDTNGHPAGDMALQITAHCLKAGLRSADVAARYGGEEFCILLPQTSVREAITIAERMRHRVATAHYPHGSTQPLGSVTISIGVATLAKHVDTAEKVIAAADRALYTAKHQGKNRVESYQDSLGGDSGNE